MTFARDKHPKAAVPLPQDQIQVVGHLAATGEPVTRFLTTEHYGHEYLYLEHAAGRTVTLVNLGDPSRPTELAEMSYPLSGTENVVAAVGNAALVTASNASNAAVEAAPATFRIMSFADPAHPVVQQEFTGVTAMATDDKRGLIFLANAQGVWILQQQYAVDPEKAKFEKELEHSIYDAH